MTSPSTKSAGAEIGNFLSPPDGKDIVIGRSKDKLNICSFFPYFTLNKDKVNEIICSYKDL